MKKGQLQIFETAMVLLFFFIIVGLGIMFYAWNEKNRIGERLEEEGRGIAVEIALSALDMPEIKCTISSGRTGGIVINEGCVDAAKISAFQAYLAENDFDASVYYFSKMQFSNITVKEIYPDQTTIKVYSRVPAEEDGKGDKNIQSFRMPVALYDPVTDSYSMAKMEVKVFQ